MHFALVRQINAEVGHVPDAALTAWQETGPRAVARTMSRWMARLAEQGLLRVPDPDRAAAHFVLLSSTEVTSRTFHGALPMAQDEIDRIATAGVEAFLRAYRP